jgi:hypothetical protein
MRAFFAFIAIGAVLLVSVRLLDHYRTEASIAETRRLSAESREATLKYLKDKEEELRAAREIESKKMAEENRRWQDRTTALCGRDHFDTPEQERASVDRAVCGWLDELRKGRDASWTWYIREGAKWVPLYAVRDYEIVDRPAHDRRIVRIHHSTREGVNGGLKGQRLGG